MLREAMILAYCGAVGFACAGMSASLFRLVTSRPPRFALLGRSWFAAFTSFLFFAVCGPAILATASIRRQRDGSHSLGLAIGGLAVALLWSVCSGIIVLDIALAIRRELI